MLGEREKKSGQAVSSADCAEFLQEVVARLADCFGPLHWWPADTPFEVVVGAILTQNTAWTNVEKTMVRLKAADVLSPRAMAAVARPQLEGLIRPAGFFRQKAERLQLFSEYLLDRYAGEVRQLLAGPLEEVRARLLSLKGVGPETADSILLYAGDRPSFVVDAYTRRLFSRLGLLQGAEPYEAIRALFMQNLPLDVELFNECHALIVEQCKSFCKKAPLCADCSLLAICPHGQKVVKSEVAGRRC